MCTCMCMCISMCVYQITGLAFACGGVVNRVGGIYTKKAGIDGWMEESLAYGGCSFIHA